MDTERHVRLRRGQRRPSGDLEIPAGQTHNKRHDRITIVRVI